MFMKMMMYLKTSDMLTTVVNKFKVFTRITSTGDVRVTSTGDVRIVKEVI